MSKADIPNAKNPDQAASLTAQRRPAKAARETAVHTNTGSVIVQDGRLVHVSADELRKSAKGWEKNGSKSTKAGGLDDVHR